MKMSTSTRNIVTMTSSLWSHSSCLKPTACIITKALKRDKR